MYYIVTSLHKLWNERTGEKQYITDRKIGWG